MPATRDRQPAHNSIRAGRTLARRRPEALPGNTVRLLGRRCDRGGMHRVDRALPRGRSRRPDRHRQRGGHRAGKGGRGSPHARGSAAPIRRHRRRRNAHPQCAAADHRDTDRRRGRLGGQRNRRRRDERRSQNDARKPAPGPPRGDLRSHPDPGLVARGNSVRGHGCTDPLHRDIHHHQLQPAGGRHCSGRSQKSGRQSRTRCLQWRPTSTRAAR